MDAISLPVAGAAFFDRADARAILETQVLPQYLPARRWFGSKSRQPQAFTVLDLPALGEGRLALVRVTYAEGAAETYALPLQVCTGCGGEVIAQFTDRQTLCDGLQSESFRAALLHALAHSDAHGSLRGVRGSALPADYAALPSQLLALEQSNSSLKFGDRVFVKLFRKLEEGMNPDVEITRYLSEQRHFTHVPPFAGSLSYHGAARVASLVVALALGLIENAGDAWALSLAAVGQYLALVRDLNSLPAAHPPLLGEMADEPDSLYELAGPFVARVRKFGVRTAETHLALAAADKGDPAFAPEPFTAADQRALGLAVEKAAQQMISDLRPRAGEEPLIGELLAAAPALTALASRIGAQEVIAAKIRTHGDYHLGQVLATADDFILLDFEGEPQRSLAERKQKRSPLRDVAGMLRSFHYAAHSGLNEFPQHRIELTPWAEHWSALMSRTFLRAWVETSAGAPYLPAKPEEIGLLLNAFLLEKAIYEVGYELNNRPTWLNIPLRGILQIAYA